MSAQTPRLGVIMLCHDNLDIVARQAQVWVNGGAAVVIHVDRKAPAAALAQLQEELAGLSSVSFSPRHHCEWGQFSLVRATLDAADMMLDRYPGVGHVFLASGSCLPLRPINDLNAYLKSQPDTDFIESVRATDVDWTIGGLGPERFEYYFPFSWRKRRWLFDALTAVQRGLGIRRRTPNGIVPHMGSQWWCLTATTLGCILADPRRREFDRYFRNTWIPDESYFQTLVRLHSTRIESRSLTLAKFDMQGKPYMLYDDHRQMLEESDCFVARKIWPGADGLYRHFPRPDGAAPDLSEPRPERIERLINRASARRKLGRPGLYMQSRFPRMDAENGKTSARYAIFQGFSDVFPHFEEWLADRLEATVHGHLFSPVEVEFEGRHQIGPGALSSNAALRDHDPQGFLAALIRVTDSMQAFQFSPRDSQKLNWFISTDPNAHIAVITGAWVVPLLHSGMPQDDIRRATALLQRAEKKQLEILQSVWVKARVRVWTLADFLARPAGILTTALMDIDPLMSPVLDDLPIMRDISNLPVFLRDLRNAGLHVDIAGDFPVPGTLPGAPDRSTRHA